MRATTVLSIALVLLPLTMTGVARADGDEKTRAKEAYTRGLKAHDAHDYPAAARAFAEADTILPSAVALGAALDAAVDADDPALGAELLERGARPGATPALNASIAAARKKLGGRAGKVRLVCPSGALCRVVIEGRETTSEMWVAIGKRVAAVTVDSAMKEQLIEVRANEPVVLKPERPAPSELPVSPPPAPPPLAPTEPPASTDPPPGSAPGAPSSIRVVPPAVVYVGGALTLALAGGAVATGVVALGQRSDFEAKGCDRGPATGCGDIQETGRKLVPITNVLIVSAALMGALTIGVAAVLTNWHPTAAVLPGGGGYAGIHGSF